MHSANDLSATRISIWQQTKISYLTYSPAVRKSAKENPTSVYRFDIEIIGLDIIKENTERNTNLSTSFLFNIVMYRKHNKPSGVSDWKFRCTEYGRQTQTVDEKIFSENLKLNIIFLKICRLIINLLFVSLMCVWKFENWLKTYNFMTLNIKLSSKLSSKLSRGRKGLIGTREHLKHTGLRHETDYFIPR